MIQPTSRQYSRRKLTSRWRTNTIQNRDCMDRSQKSEWYQTLTGQIARNKGTQKTGERKGIKIIPRRYPISVLKHRKSISSK